MTREELDRRLAEALTKALVGSIRAEGESPAVWREDLQTSACKLVYDFTIRTGTLILPDLCCTDMSGAVRLFKAIDPNVQRIVTMSGDVVDTLYTRTLDGWKASA